jgi:pilus assembly protein Flp/PilA
MQRLAHALRAIDGATTIEFGLILAFIVLLMFTGLQALANATTGTWNTVSNQVSTAITSAS